MKEKALKYIVILLMIPIVISLVIAIASGQGAYSSKHSYDSLSGDVHYDALTYEQQVKRSNTFVYLSVFSLVIIGVGVWIYVKKKGEV